MLVNRRWRLVALLALLAVGAWIVLCTYALLDASFDYASAALAVAALWALVSFAVAFTLAPAPPGLVAEFARGVHGCRAPPSDLLRT